MPHTTAAANLTSVERRKKSIFNGSTFFALSFMVPWIPFSMHGQSRGMTSHHHFIINHTGSSWMKGLHLTLSLSFYDSMYTYMSLAQNALFADMTTNLAHRNTIIRSAHHITSHHITSPRYSQFASIAGTSCVFLAFYLYDHDNLLPFRILTTTAALSAWLLMRYTARNAAVIPTEGLEPVLDKPIEAKREHDGHSFFAVAKQVVKSPNFRIFVAMNFLQVFDVTVSSNFFAIYEKNLLGHDAWPAGARSVIVGASFLLPQVFAITMTPFVAQYGSYTVIMCVRSSSPDHCPPI